MEQQKERLNSLLFLEFNRDKAAEIFSAKQLINETDELYVPVNPEFLVQKITNNEVPKDLPVAEFIIGMAFALAIDPDFKYAADYRAMLKGFQGTEQILKKKIAQLFEQEKRMDSYLLLKRLYEVSGDEETENILLSTGEELALADPAWMTEVLQCCEEAIVNGNANGYLIRGSLENARGNEVQALTALKSYLEKGGEATSAVLLRIEELERNTRAEDAYRNIQEDPRGSLETLLELYPREQTNPRLIFAIAVCYRLLGNHEKAIFYLEEAQSLDPGYFDVLNELGLNYALMEDFGTARDYFKAVFDATRELEPMTNLMISLFHLGETEEALELFRRAEEIAPEDEILQRIRQAYVEGV